MRRPVAAPEANAWDRLPGWVQHAVCVGALVVASLAFFSALHFSGKGLVPSDTVQWRSMAEVLLEADAQTGSRPLWNPNAFAGMPAYTISYPEQVPQADSLVRMLRSALWPSSHMIVLLVGAYLFVFYLTRNRLAGVLAAFAYGLTTYLPVLLSAGHDTKFIALAFAPWMALAFAHVLRRPGLLAGLLFAIAAAVNLRANHIQITYYFTFLLGLWWLVEGVGAARHGRLKAFGASTAWLVAGSVLALLMVAHPYLALWEYKGYSTRGGTGGGGLAWDYAMAWSQGLGELVTLLVAGAYGGGGGTYWGPKPFTAGPHYVGGVVLALALLAVWRYRRNAVYALGLGALLMTLFSLGEHLPALNRLMFDHFPLFDAFRVPETWLAAVAFALTALAGLGAAYAVAPAPSAEAERDKTKAVYTALGVVAGLVLLLFVAKGAFFDFEKPGQEQEIAQQIAAQNNVPVEDPRVAQAAREYVAQFRAEREDLFSDDALRTLLFLLLAGGVLVAFRKGKIPAWATVGALALLVLVDLWGVGRRFLNEDMLAPTRRIEQQIPTYGFDRFLLEREAEAGGPGHFRVLSFEGGSPMQNARPSYHHESLGGYSPAKIRLYQDFIDHLYRQEGTGLPDETMLDLLNTRYVVAPAPLPGYDVAFRDEQTQLLVLENPDVLPRAFFVGETQVVEDREATFAALRDPAFDPRRTALLPAPIDFATTPLDSSSTATAVLDAYTPDEVAWRVETDAPRLLVLSEVYYPAGWKAELDGAEVPIYRADYLLRAVPVPAGAHRLVLRFEPQSHRLGVLVAGATTALVYGGVLLLLGLAWHRRRRAAGASAEAATEAHP